MIGEMSRRHFFKCCGTAAVMVGTPPQVWAAGTIKKAGNRINLEWHGFDEQEAKLLVEAMKLVAKRIQNRRTWLNVYNLRPDAFLTDKVMKNSNYADDVDGRYNLLMQQLYWLSQPPEFPKVHLRAFNEESNVLGRARTDLVIIKANDDDLEVEVSGEFDVEINRYQMAEDRPLRDLDELAATIAHEMLHNLGHLHDKGDYSDKKQINVFTNAIYCDGLYRRRGYKFRSSHMR